MSVTSYSLFFFFRFFFFFFFSAFYVHSKSLPHLSSPYLSPTTISPNYHHMLKSFKIFIYPPDEDLAFDSRAESLFYASLQNSPFVTHNAEEAHLFFVPFSSSLSTRSIARVIRRLRLDLPYWNRTLGADHFYLSCAGLGFESDRNIVELKKNSVQISCFPASDGKFIPHKDISLPPLANSRAANAQANKTTSFLGYFRHTGVKESTLAKKLVNDPDFLIESELSDQLTYAERLASSKFCLFEYGVDVSGIGEALRFGCVPAVITDRPIQDLPFMDMLRWQEIAVFVPVVGVKELKRVLVRTWGDRHEQMIRLGAKASQHFVWNELPQLFDSFQTVMYELWLRRHSIRYPRRESE
ncbi:hypothetical protein CJ030_MR3G014777 [Morella rubra]|uniref:Exostosin GT47 domain-containing protein n=1 Tax=Morella rubra TaxID=262757 RepID=A0A6A1VYN4_9ROSI|nr:hypothetical protein CJ030_MR3G014777 [Morella rubra]